jgi:hypothetical protein
MQVIAQMCCCRLLQYYPAAPPLLLALALLRHQLRMVCQELNLS